MGVRVVANLRDRPNEQSRWCVYSHAVTAPMDNTPSSPTRRGSRTRKIRITAGIALVILVVGYFALLPWLAREIIMARLHEAGVANASFSINRVSPFGLTMRHVSLGDTQSFHVDAIHVSFSPRSLWHGRLK